jgi:hypothetical protein
MLGRLSRLDTRIFGEALPWARISWVDGYRSPMLKLLKRRDSEKHLDLPNDVQNARGSGMVSNLSIFLGAAAYNRYLSVRYTTMTPFL